MIRTGIGYDTHKLVKGDNLVVGGISIPSNYKSVGHSDGDSLIHAIIDSILGAANLGDIGKYFPSDDESLKGSPENQVSVKATTTDGLGFIGTSEGWSALAISTLTTKY